MSNKLDADQLFAYIYDIDNYNTHAWSSKQSFEIITEDCISFLKMQGIIWELFSSRQKQLNSEWEQIKSQAEQLMSKSGPLMSKYTKMSMQELKNSTQEFKNSIQEFKNLAQELNNSNEQHKIFGASTWEFEGKNVTLIFKTTLLFILRY